MRLDENGDPVEYPSLLTQAGTTLKAVAKFAASGCKTVDQDRYERRLEICRGCPLFDATASRCTSCGCLTSVKLRMASESCPHPEGARWGPE